jgi:hypothetical protein
MITLWGYIEDKHDIFGVSTSPEDTIDELKKQIYDEQRVQLIGPYSYSDLSLTKVRYIMISM